MGQSGDMFFSLMPRGCHLVHTTHFAHPFSNSPQTAAAVNTVAHHILWDKLKCHAKEVVLSIHYSHICSPLLVADISGIADCTCTLRARCSHLLHPTKGNAPSPSLSPPPPIPLPTNTTITGVPSNSLYNPLPTPFPSRRLNYDSCSIVPSAVIFPMCLFPVGTLQATAH